MMRQYSFLIIFFALLTSLAWWSGRAETPNATFSVARPIELPQSEWVPEVFERRELIEVLDLLVEDEHRYRSVHGHFTKLVSRLRYSIPRDLLQLYDIHVSQVSAEHLLITAFSDGEGRAEDRISIDQNYEIQASFALPSPRLEYLKDWGMRQLRAMRDLPQGQPFNEQGVYKGFFRFEQKWDSQGHAVVFAVGVRAPVTGVQLDIGAGEEGGVFEGGVAPHLASERLERDSRTLGRTPSSDIEPIEIEEILSPKAQGR